MFYPQIINFNKLSHEINPPAIGVPPGLSQLPGILHDCSRRLRPGLGTAQERWDSKRQKSQAIDRDLIHFLAGGQATLLKNGEVCH